MAKKKLEDMGLPDLWKRFKEVTGKENKSPNKKFLVKAIKEADAKQREAERAARREQIATTAGAHLPAGDDTADDLALATVDAGETQPAEPDVGSVEVHGSSHNHGELSPPADDIGADTAGDDAAVRLHVPDDEADLEVAMEAQANLATAADGEGATPDAPDDEAVADTPLSKAAAAPVSAKTARGKGRFAGMSVAELQALYLEKVGRPTGSDDADYMIWKIREAEKGKITVGAIKRSGGAGGDRPKRYDDLTIGDLQKLFEEKTGAATDSQDREVLVRGILTAERAAARTMKRFADVTTGDLQKLYEEKTGEATDSQDRAYLIHAVAAAPAERNIDLSRYGSDRDNPVLPLRLRNIAVKTMDQTWVANGYKSRIAFIREAIRDKLTKLGADDAAALFA
jgi:hypothetical protein